MATAGKLPVYVSIGGGDKHEIGTLDLSVGEMLAYCEGKVEVQIDPDLEGRMAGMLESAAAAIRERAR